MSFYCVDKEDILLISAVRAFLPQKKELSEKKNSKPSLMALCKKNII